MNLNCLENKKQKMEQKKLNMLNDEINDILDYLQFEFKYRTLKNRLVALEGINKIERLKQ